MQQAKSMPTVPNTLFDACEVVVMQNLLDTYSRFYKHASFQKHISQQ